MYGLNTIQKHVVLLKKIALYVYKFGILLRAEYRFSFDFLHIYFTFYEYFLWYWEQCWKISGLYDKNCALGTHLKFMRRQHSDDSALSHSGQYLIISDEPAGNRVI